MISHGQQYFLAQVLDEVLPTMATIRRAMARGGGHVLGRGERAIGALDASGAMPGHALMGEVYATRARLLAEALRGGPDRLAAQAPALIRK